MQEAVFEAMVKEVAAARGAAERARAALRAEEAKLEPLREAVRLADEAVAAAEARLRSEAIAWYVETGNKSPHPAVGIRIMRRLEYDAMRALEYCRQHLPSALKLDRTAFEKAARAIPLDFVVVREEPQATIAQDLGEG